MYFMYVAAFTKAGHPKKMVQSAVFCEKAWSRV